MRAISCPCGHHFEGASDEELFGLCREHVDRDHPEMQRTDEQLRERIAADAYEPGGGLMSGAGAWMRANLTTQGYRLTDSERRELAVGLRFSTGTCLALVVVALALQSVVMVFALCAVGLAAGFTTRHPFDHVWNRAVGHLAGGALLPPNPQRRRDAFKVGTAWLTLVGVLLAAGATTGALVLSGLLIAACATVTATNLCLPSEMFAWFERRRTSATKPITTGGELFR